MLSMAVGTIQILLVDEHMRVMWGIIFLTMGVPQLGCGIIMMFVDSWGQAIVLFQLNPSIARRYLPCVVELFTLTYNKDLKSTIRIVSN
jgi:hypothetical protein